MESIADAHFCMKSLSSGSAHSSISIFTIMLLHLPTLAFLASVSAQGDLSLPTINFAPVGARNCKYAYGGIGVVDHCYETRFYGHNNTERQYTWVEFLFPEPNLGTACAGKLSLLQW